MDTTKTCISVCVVTSDRQTHEFTIGDEVFSIERDPFNTTITNVTKKLIVLSNTTLAVLITLLKKVNVDQPKESDQIILDQFLFFTYLCHKP